MKIRKIIALFLSLAVLSASVFADSPKTMDKLPSALDFRAVWVSTVLNLDYPLNQTSDAAYLKNQADEILNGAADMGMNAIILQVRPASDAFYDSDIFPWSKYLTGTAGQAPSDNFDPMKYFIDEAHKRKMQLHAWINPYRITKNTASDKITSLSQLPEGHPARQNPSWAIEYKGDFYFDPGIPAVRRLIVDSALEIVRKYDVDGIHMDDYFYPGTDFADDDTYSKYKGSYTSKDDWRRNNVDMLIKSLNDALHAEAADIRFGISPFGIWANSKNMAEGSKTNGGESYTQHYADTRKWVKLGWLDYIAPQLYWHIGHSAADYKTLVGWWADTVRDTGVDLYIGQAAYRVGDENQNKAWATPAELVRQMSLNCRYDEVKGSIFFRYQNFANLEVLSDTISEVYKSVLSSGEYKKGRYELAVNRPEKDIETTLSSYYVGGSSDSGKPLFVNGELVLARSENGFFGELFELKMGKNTVVYTQGDKTVTRTINRVKENSKTVLSLIPTAEKADITKPYPSSNIYIKNGQSAALSCTAPIGAEVKATLDGKTYRLIPKDKKAPDQKAIYTTTYEYSIPMAALNGALSQQGAVRYDLTYKNQKIRKLSDGTIGVYTTPSALEASFTSDAVSGYMTASSSGGPYAEISGSMSDDVIDIKGSYVKLASNLYVLQSNVKLSAKKDKALPVKSASYDVQANGNHTVTVEHAGGTGWAKFDSDTGTLVFSVSPATKPVNLVLTQNSLFKSAEAVEKTDRVTYTMVLKDDVQINGYYCEAFGTKTVLNIIPKKKIKSGAYPLSAHTIVIDPGHGGIESGALGLLGSEYPEKAINLRNALALKTKLESLGATVILTRSDDIKVTLEDRVALSRDKKPDLFISMHANSLAENSDVSAVSGFSVFYRENISQNAASTVFSYSDKNLGRGNKGVHQSNLYVGRGTWCPALIYETAFMPNPSDFDWLIDENTPAALAENMAFAIVEYFS